MDTQKENRFFGFLAIALALFGVVAPYRWHDMSPIISNGILGSAMFFAILALWHALPSKLQEVAKK